MTATTRGDTRAIPAKTDPRLPVGMHSEALIDVGGLERRLRRAVKGEVRFDPASIAMYANDADTLRPLAGDRWSDDTPVSRAHRMTCPAPRPRPGTRLEWPGAAVSCCWMKEAANCYPASGPRPP